MISIFNIFKESNYSFDGQRNEETVNIFLYKHWIIIFLRLLGLASLLLVPIIPLIIFSGLIGTYHLEGLVFFILIIFYLLLWSSAFFSITMYLLDTWIVTNERVIDMKQRGFFSRTISEMQISKVQDISVKTVGLIPTMFGYGDIEIQSAGTIDKFVFKQVPHPNKVKDQIMDLVKKSKAGGNPNL